MTRLILLPRAEVDILEAAVWYETEQGGLGRVFQAELEDVLARVSEGPRQFKSAKQPRMPHANHDPTSNHHRPLSAQATSPDQSRAPGPDELTRLQVRLRQPGQPVA